MIRQRSGLTSSFASLLLASAVWLCPGQARAEDDATVVARERFKEGVQFFDKKEFDKARVAFLQAYALKKHPAVLLNLAHSELQSGREADAAKHFAMYLREAKNPTDTEKQGAESGLLAAKAVVGEVEISVEDGAEVYIDGNLEGRSPLPGPAFVDPGSHTIEAKKDGRTAETEVTASAGQATSASLRFEAKAAAARSPKQDGVESSGEAEPEADTGPSDGRKPFFKWVGDTPVAWVGAGVTAVGIIGGVSFAVAARSSYDSADSVAAQITDTAGKDSSGRDTTGVCRDPRAWLVGVGFDVNRPPEKVTERVGEYQDACQKFSDNQASGDTMKTLSIVSWAVAGAAAAGTVVYYFIDSGAPKEQGSTGGVRMAVHPIVTPTERGFGLVGSF